MGRLFPVELMTVVRRVGFLEGEPREWRMEGEMDGGRKRMVMVSPRGRRYWFRQNAEGCWVEVRGQRSEVRGQMSGVRSENGNPK